jgi:glycosyltransferase involved in cell wall biosynthesis
VRREAFYKIGRRLPVVGRWQRFQYQWAHHASIDRFAANSVLDESTRVVLGREDGALDSFRRGRLFGARTVYDLPTAHYQTVCQIMQHEEEEFPGICEKASTALDFSPVRAAHKDAELATADHVIAPSAFVQQSVIRTGFPAEAISVLPFASEPAWLADAGRNGTAARQSNLILHVANLGLRKGTHRLLRVWKRLGAYRSHQLRLIGTMSLKPAFLRDFQGCYEHIPRLPQEQLRPHYAAATAFVLPAAAEGFAVVILEALSYGVPIVASRNSGADGFLEHQKQALLHEFGNEEELAAHLDWILSHPRERAEMAGHAREKARSWTWDGFRQRFLEILSRIEEQEPTRFDGRSTPEKMPMVHT